MQHAPTATAAPKKYPPLTAAQQAQVLNYRKIAADFARRLAAPYSRLIEPDEAESIGMLTLCRAAQRFDAERASGLWPLARLMIPQQIGEAVHAAMARSRGRCGLAALDRNAAPVATPDERAALRTIAAWAEEDPARAETIDRAVSGAELTPADLATLEALRDELGLPSPEVADVPTAARALGRSAKALRSGLARGTVPGYRCGTTWRVFLRAAVRCA